VSPRGGTRQGTPGVGYSNRSDLLLNRAPQTGTQTAASAGVTPAATPAPAAPTGPLPDQIPTLTTPSQRPGEPLTTGLSTGPGAGPEALGSPPAMQQNATLAKYLPWLEFVVKSDPTVGENVVNLVRYLKGIS
jgi:hypothetical protein